MLTALQHVALQELIYVSEACQRGNITARHIATVCRILQAAIGLFTLGGILTFDIRKTESFNGDLRGTLPHIFIDIGGKDYVANIALTQLQIRGNGEPNGTHLSAAESVIMGTKLEFKMLSAGKVDQIGDRNALHHQNGLKILQAEGLHGLHLTNSLQGNVGEIYLTLNFKRQGRIGFYKILLCILIDALTEIVDAILVDGKARSKLVTTVFAQKILAGGQGIHQRKALNASAGALCNVSVIGEENARQGEFLGNLRCYHTDNTLVPAIGAKDKEAIILTKLLDLLKRLLVDLLLHSLAKLIGFAKLTGNLIGKLLILGH